MKGSMSIQLSHGQLLLGGGIALLLGVYAFASGWLNWAGLFRLHPLLSIPCTLSLFVAPVAFYCSIRQMIETGWRFSFLAASFLSAASLGFIAMGLRLWLRNWAG